MNVLGSPSPLHPSSLSTGTEPSNNTMSSINTFTNIYNVVVSVCVKNFLCFSVIHRTQVWFHGRIMREEAHKMMIQQGQVDG